MSISSILKKKFEERWDTVPDFRQRTGCPLSPESISSAIFRGKQLSAPSLIVFCHFLGFSPAEIRKILKDSGDTLFWHLIGDSKQMPLAAHHKAILEAVDIVLKKDPAVLNNIGDHLHLIAKALGADISAQVRMLKKRRG